MNVQILNGACESMHRSDSFKATEIAKPLESKFDNGIRVLPRGGKPYML